ncbi:hypothetical protein ACH40F_08190 [Streptomyces sp. NPDC020794]|uniref:hypothetical protein n=1 Tax=unclassified Streptomyces TaxID=2593676 RepID=UPI0036E114BB
MTRLKQAARAKQRADKRAKDLVRTATEAFDQAVVAALGAGLKPAQVATTTGYSYETIRRIARAHEVERLREPTVTSRRKAQSDDES